MKLSKVILRSQDKEKLGQFLSQLFEMELGHHGERVVLHQDSGLTFELVDLLEPVSEGNTVINLSFSELEELHHLIQKIRFIEYRLDFPSIKMTDLFNDGEDHYFEFVDLDHRIWRLSSKC